MSTVCWTKTACVPGDFPAFFWLNPWWILHRLTSVCKTGSDYDGSSLNQLLDRFPALCQSWEHSVRNWTFLFWKFGVYLIRKQSLKVTFMSMRKKSWILYNSGLYNNFVAEIIMVICYFCCHMTDANPAVLFSLQAQPPLPQCHQKETRHTEELNTVGKQSAVSQILWSHKSA